MGNRQFRLVPSCALYGIEGILVEIEVSILPGLPVFEIVGLGDSAVRESKNRVHAAICNSGFAFPQGRIIASYAPAWLRKEGSAFDLPLALAILAAAGSIPLPQQPPCVIGELGLNGDVRRIPGVFCRALACRKRAMSHLVVPRDNAAEADAAMPGSITPVSSLREAAAVMSDIAALQSSEYFPDLEPARKIRPEMPAANRCPEEPADRPPADPSAEPAVVSAAAGGPDLASVVGQEKAVRALLLAACGRHNLLLLGSPGCGKTTLASAMPALMPALTYDEAMQVTGLYSASGLLGDGEGLVWQRPFRAPHHAITRAAMIGGGSMPRPGEVSLAHLGVLFLDEMTEYHPEVLDLLRQPLEHGRIRLVRLQHSMVYPADFMLVGAANPCRCGEYLEPNASCRCSPEKVRDHLNRISGPLLDRIDLTAEMTRLKRHELAASVKGESSVLTTQAAAGKVRHCWQVQFERCRSLGIPVQFNGRLSSAHLSRDLIIPDAVTDFAVHAADRLGLSARSCHKVLRLARTIADLDDSRAVQEIHVAEAMQYRLHQPV